MVKLFRPRNAPVASLFGQVAQDERVYAIGDIHGRVDLLHRMIELIALDAEACSDDRTPRLIFLGDYIDHGPRSRDVISSLMLLEDMLVFEGIEFLLGRHEAMLLDFLDNPTTETDWLRAGGMATIESYQVAPPGEAPSDDTLLSIADAMVDCLEDHLDFLRNCRLTTRSGDIIFAHSAFDPLRSLEKQTRETVLWGAADAMNRAALRGLRLVHGATDSTHPITTPHRICVDTGAYYTDRLTAVRLDETETFLTAEPS